MAAALPQEREQSIGRHRLGHPDDRPQQRRDRQVAGLHEPRDDVLDVKNADDGVERAAIDGHPAVGARRDDAKHFVERHGLVDRDEPGARHHELLRAAQAETQRAVQPDLLLRLQQPAVAAFRDEQHDLLGRVHVTVSGGRHAHQLEQQHAAAVQERDRPREHTNRPLHRQDGEEGRGGGILERQRLRHELADDDREGGEENQDDGSGGRFGRCGLHRAESLEQGREAGRERGLPVRAQDQARQGDADLRRRDVPIELLGILEHRQDPRREDIAIFSHPPQPAPPRTHRGELGRHIKPRQQDECDDDDPRQEHSRGSYLQKAAGPLCLGRRRPFCRRSFSMRLDSLRSLAAAAGASDRFVRQHVRHRTSGTVDTLAPAS